MKSNAANSTGLQEDSKLTRVIGLMACVAVATASLWLFNFSQAQDSGLPEGMPWASFGDENEAPASSSAEPFPGSEMTLAQADPFNGRTDSFEPVTESAADSGMQSVVKDRIQAELKKAVAAKEAGQTQEALRLATTARDLARRFQIVFSQTDLTPNDLIAQLKEPVASPQMPTSQPTTQDANQLVKDARKLILSGKYDLAREKALQAKGMNVAYGPFDDRPEHVLSDLQRLQRTQTPAAMVAEAPTPTSPQMSDPGFGEPNWSASTVDQYTVNEQDPRVESQRILALAEQAVQEGRYEDARQLAAQANELNTTYELFDRSPGQIQAMVERASNSTMIASKQPTANNTPVTPATEIPQLPNADGKRGDALALLANAREAISRGDMATAKALVAQAEQQQVSYTLFDDRPQLVLAEIQAVEKQQMLAQTRTQYIHSALKEKYPDLTYLGDLSWTSTESMRGSDFDIIDRHYYNSTRWFTSRFHEYDHRDRSLPPLYLGEVAVTTGEAGPTRGNLRAALAEGVFLQGCERNADVVRMVSYAPLLAHVKGRTALTGSPPPWHAMIYFDGTRVCGTASYYLWKLFTENRPDQMHQIETTQTEVPDLKIAGQIGVGTWDASAEYRALQVTLAGGTIWKPDLALGAELPGQGNWQLEETLFRQARRGFGMTYFGEPNWTDYTVNLQARKLSGGEGFLIAFGRQNEDRFWWNLGGWGNSQHAVERNQVLVGTGRPGKIETNRWYDIRIEIAGAEIKCYLDGELLHEVTFKQPQKFFATAGSKEDGALVIKAINIGAEPQRATLNLDSVSSSSSSGTLTVLSSPDPTINNTLTNPEQITPTTSELTNLGDSFDHEFPPYSLSIISFSSLNSN